MKSERRHDLEKNELADKIGSGIQSAQSILPLVVGIIAVLALGGLGWGLYSNSLKQKAATAWTEYYFQLSGGDAESFETVAEDFPESSAGRWAWQTAGNNYLARGLEAIYRDRAEGVDFLNKAIAAFEKVSDGADPELQNKANFALGQAYESLGKLETAAEYYEKVTNSTAFPALVDQARGRLAFVTSDRGKSFYTWFDKLDPKPDAPIQLPADLSLPPGSPDLEFSGSASIDPGDLPELNLGGLGLESPDNAGSGLETTAPGNESKESEAQPDSGN